MQDKTKEEAKAANEAEIVENKNEKMPAETGNEKESSSDRKSGEENNSGNRKDLLWSIAGIYLIYTAYDLGDSYFKKEEGSSLGFFLAGIAFGIIGAYLLYRVIRDNLRAEKRKKAEAAAQQAAAGEENGKAAGGREEKTLAEKAAGRKAAGQPQKMSISQRARLVESLSEAEDVPAQSESPDQPEISDDISDK